MMSNNPANINSLAAKEGGLSYWEYMEKNNLAHIQHYAWTTKKVTRKQKREGLALINEATERSNHPMMRLVSQMRTLIGRSAY